jgi:hypothetical protein
MALLGKTLTVYVAADTSKLRAGLNDADRSLSGFAGKLGNMVGPALIGATAAAGAFAVSLAVDGVQAAVAEEAELTKLSGTLNNLGFGAASDQVNTFIDDLQYTAAVSDSTLRPAFTRLLTSTNDVAEAQKLLQLALDVSAGTGKSLEAVTNALGKAYDGNLGALGKLGAGIDSSTIKSKDLQGAVSQLSTTFAGQSTAAANTLQGQIKVLSISFDELKESFGKGFLDGLSQSSGGIGNLAKNMRDLQPELEAIGKGFGDFTTKLIESLGWIAKLDQGIQRWGNEVTGRIAVGLIQLGDLIGVVSDAEAEKADRDFEVYKSSLYAAEGTNAQAAALANLASIQAGMDRYVRGGYGGIPASKMFTDIETWRTKQLALIKPIETTAKATGGMSKAIKEMDPALRKQIDLVKSLTSELSDAAKAVETARKEMYNWQEQMANQITSGIDLGAAFGAQFDDEGKATGKSLIEGFNKQIEQAGLFGGYLQTLNTQGGPELRDAVAGLGPEIGNKLAKQIIDEGLVKTFQDKLVTVKSTARTAAEAMTPEFLVAGVQSAVNFLIGTQNALGAATSQLEEMGRAMGKTIGDAAAEEIRAALAAAGVAMGAGNATLAGTNGQGISNEAAARIAAGGGSYASTMSSTSIMQAIQNAILQSDQRLGRTGQVLNA